MEVWQLKITPVQETELNHNLEDLEEEATHSVFLLGNPKTEEPGRLIPWGCKVGHNVTKSYTLMETRSWKPNFSSVCGQVYHIVPWFFFQ